MQNLTFDVICSLMIFRQKLLTKKIVSKIDKHLSRLAKLGLSSTSFLLKVQTQSILPEIIIRDWNKNPWFKMVEQKTKLYKNPIRGKDCRNDKYSLVLGQPFLFQESCFHIFPLLKEVAKVRIFCYFAYLLPR